MFDTCRLAPFSLPGHLWPFQFPISSFEVAPAISLGKPLSLLNIRQAFFLQMNACAEMPRFTLSGSGQLLVARNFDFLSTFGVTSVDFAFPAPFFLPGPKNISCHCSVPGLLVGPFQSFEDPSPPRNHPSQNGVISFPWNPSDNPPR